MTIFRFVGEVIFLGRAYPVDLQFETDNLTLAGLLAQIVCQPDDQDQAMPAMSRGVQRNPATTRNAFDMLDNDTLSDEQKRAVIASHFPDLANDLKVKEANPNPIPTSLPPPDPKTADLARLRPVIYKLIRPDGSAHLSNIAKELGRSAGGSGWSYIQELGTILEQETAARSRQGKEAA